MVRTDTRTNSCSLNKEVVKICVSDLDPDPHGYALLWVSQIQIRSLWNRQKYTLFSLILIPNISFYCIYLSKYVCERIKYQVFGISPCFWVLKNQRWVVRTVLHRSCHPFRWWPIQPAILSYLFCAFPITLLALFAALTSSLSVPSPPPPPSCHPFRGWPFKPAILPSLFILSPLPRESFLSSCFDGVPSILSSFSLVTHPAYHLVIFFTLSPFFFVSHLSILSSLSPVNHFILSFLSVPSPLHLVIHSFSFLTRPSCRCPSSCHSFLFPHLSILSSLSAAAGLSVLSDCLVSIKI
jgi:hypothetical protein